MLPIKKIDLSKNEIEEEFSYLLKLKAKEMLVLKCPV
jgi:hypothetical protein